jgi:hypoxanthine-guanine phosphoribosyltransferase
MNKDIKKILIGEEELKAKVAELGAKITEDYKGKDLLIVCVLKGAVIFASDLIREINLPLDIDFMEISISAFRHILNTFSKVPLQKSLLHHRRHRLLFQQ